MKDTKIEWAHHTFNPWVGCTKVSPACDHCYAEAWAKRSGSVQWGGERRRTSDANWRLPLKWNRQAEREGRRYRVFCASLADVFDNQVPIEWLRDLCDLIELTPNLTWLLLTKRIGNVFERLIQARSHDFIAGQRNVWLGATICNQDEADRDIPKLLATPARVKFLSVEPMLGRIYIEDIPDPAGGVCLKPLAGLRWVGDGQGRSEVRALGGRIDWVICGGESGPGARPMHPDWARSLRDQCASASVPFLFKQWGEWLPWHHFSDAAIDDPPEQTRFSTREWRADEWIDVGRPDYWPTMDGEIDDSQCVGRVGKKAAGRLLDGRTHDEFPPTGSGC